MGNVILSTTANNYATSVVCDENGSWKATSVGGQTSKPDQMGCDLNCETFSPRDGHPNRQLVGKTRAFPNRRPNPLRGVCGVGMKVGKGGGLGRVGMVGFGWVPKERRFRLRNNF